MNIESYYRNAFAFLNQVGSYTSQEPNRSEGLCACMLLSGYSEEEMVNVEPVLTCNIQWAWATDGFQRISTDRDTMLLLAATSMCSIDPEEVVEPYRCFVIDFPNDLAFLLDDRSGRPEGVIRVWVLKEAGKWFLWTETNTNVKQLYFRLPTDTLLSDEELAPTDDAWGDLRETTDMDQRAAIIVRRIVAGICLLMSSRDPSEQGVKISTQPCKAKRGRPACKITRIHSTTVLPIIIRDAVAAYARGERGSLKTRHMVRGHWRLQAFGERHELRKRIWIRPFWKGPVGDPRGIHTTVIT